MGNYWHLTLVIIDRVDSRFYERGLLPGGVGGCGHCKTFSAQLSVLLSNLIATPSLRELAAFAILFVLTLLIGGMANYLLGALVKMTGLSGTDRMLGVLFGVARGFIVVMLIIVFLPSLLPVEQDAWWQQSILVAQLLTLEGWAREVFTAVADAVSALMAGSAR